MKKGFTLVELLGVIALLGILAVLVVPAVNKTIKNSRETLYQTQIDTIKEAAKTYSYKFPKSIPDGNEIFYVTVGQLVEAGLLEDQIENPKNKEMFPYDMKIHIYQKNGNLTYEVNEGSGTTGNYGDEVPFIQLEGEPVQKIKQNSLYQEKNVKATSQSGGVSLPVTKTIELNGSVVSSIDTSKVGIYYIKYQAIDQGKIGLAIRTVVIEHE